MTTPIHSRPRSAYPGDKTRIMLHPHTDRSGREWPAKTEYVPLSMGADNTACGTPTIQVVTIAGRRVEFVGRENVRPALCGWEE